MRTTQAGTEWDDLAHVIELYPKDSVIKLTIKDLEVMIRALDPALADTIKMTQKDIRFLMTLLEEPPLSEGTASS